MIEKKAITSHPIDYLISSRWSPRSFTLDKKVSRWQILSCLEAGRWAPSCFGDEPWRYIVLDREHDIDAYNRAFDCLDKWNQGWVKNCQVLLISFAYSKFRRNGKVNRWCQHDTGAASISICLQATALGLMAHQMGGYDKDKVIQEFGVPENYTPMSMIAIGYRDEEELLGEDYYESEISVRKRLPLGENFFDGTWNKPIT